MNGSIETCLKQYYGVFQQPLCQVDREFELFMPSLRKKSTKWIPKMGNAWSKALHVPMETCCLLSSATLIPDQCPFQVKWAVAEQQMEDSGALGSKE